MIRAVASGFVLIWATPAFATCDLPIMRCTFEDGAKAVRICLSDNNVTYAFGPVAGAPDLAMSVPVAELDYVPWPGVGSAVWDMVTFYNGDYSYEVVAGFERNPEDPAQFGGIRVAKTGQEIANLNCDPGSVDWGWGTDLFDAKQAVGLCWDYGRDAEWKPC